VICPNSPSPRTTTLSPSVGRASPNSLKRYSSNGSEGAFLEGDVVRHLGDEILRHEVDARVIGVADSAASHPIAHAKPADSRAYFQDCSRA